MNRRNLEHLNVPESSEQAYLNDYPHLGFGAGFPPYLRGIHTTMYVQKPWTIRQYSGFSTAEESNAFYKKNLQAGQTGLSLAFDLPTHRGYDSDHPNVKGDVGKAGVAIDTVEDMKQLFDGIPLDQMSVSMTMNGAVLPILAFYIVAAEEQGVSMEKLTGTLQNDILKEYMVRNAFIYPPEASMRIIGDIIAFCTRNMPKFNPISISGYHMQEAGATPELELAFTIANGLEYVKTGLQQGLTIDDFAPRLSFFWGIGLKHFTEIAKLRAARLLWAKYLKTYQPKNEKSLMLRAHCQTSGWSLTEQDPYNNITRTTLEALSAVMGGTQSLHTNSFDEAIALPTDESARIARNTQQILRDESKITHTVDPWAGSELVEKLTDDLYTQAEKIITEIQEMGGMIQAIEKGYPQQKIEIEAIKRQAFIESKSETIVGLNQVVVKKEKEVIHRKVDLNKVLQEQQKKLDITKQTRNESNVINILNKLTQVAKNKEINLLEVCIEAAQKRATLGEISQALETVFGRHQITPQINKGVYKTHMSDAKKLETVTQLMADFQLKYQRAPKILFLKLGQDGHDRGIKTVASGYSDLGFEVLMGDLFLSPQEALPLILKQPIDALGISSLAGAHLYLIPELMQLLHQNQLTQLKVFVGGIIPKEDYDPLYKNHISGIFGPGYPIYQSAKQILESLV